MTTEVYAPAPMFRRLMAMLYDSLILVSVFIVATLLYLLMNGFNTIPAGDIIFQGYLIFVAYLFYMFFWVKFGQTTGMVAWKLKLTDHNGNKLTFKQGTARFLLALITIPCFGLGLISGLFHKQKLTIYDIVSSTRLIHNPKL